MIDESYDNIDVQDLDVVQERKQTVGFIFQKS
jgi:hypothetical protein